MQTVAVVEQVNEQKSQIAEPSMESKCVDGNAADLLFGLSSFTTSLAASYIVFHEARLWTEPKGIAVMGICVYAMAALSWLHFVRNDKTLAVLMAGVPIAASMLGLIIGMH